MTFCAIRLGRHEDVLARGIRSSAVRRPAVSYSARSSCSVGFLSFRKLVATACSRTFMRVSCSSAPVSLLLSSPSFHRLLRDQLAAHQIVECRAALLIREIARRVCPRSA